MAERSVTSAAGWGVLHLFCTLGPSADAEAVTAAVKAAQEGEHLPVLFELRRADQSWTASPYRTLRLMVDGIAGT